MTNTTYRPIPEFEDSYLISEAGDIISLERTVRRGDHTYRVQRRRLRAGRTSTGVPRVTLSRRGVRYYKCVSVLVRQVWG